MRAAVAGGVVLGIFFSMPTSAQLPLPGLSTSGGPEIRFANSDELVNEATAAVQRIDHTLEVRGPAITKALEIVRQQIDQAKAPQDPDTPPSDIDIRVVQDLEASLGRERALLTDARRIAQAALQLAQQKADIGVGTIRLDALLNAEISARRAHAELARRQTEATRLQAVTRVDLAAVPPDATLAERSAAQDWRIQSALAERELARVVEARAKARLASQSASLSRGRVAVSEQDVAALSAAITAAEAANASALVAIEVERKRVRGALSTGKRTKDSEALRNARRSVVLARYEHLDRQKEALVVRLMEARARHLAAVALARSKSAAPPAEMSPGRVEAQLARLAQYRSSVKTARDVLTARMGTLDVRQSNLRRVIGKHRDVLVDTLSTLDRSRHHLEVVHVVSVLAASRWGAEATSKVSVLRILLSALAILLGLVLFRRGLKHAHTLTTPEGPLKRLRLKPRTIKQLDVGVSLLGPLAIAASVAAVLVWPVWEVDITAMEAVEAIDRPLFYVEDTAVSIFSIVQLFFAFWAAVVLSGVVREFLKSRVFAALELDIGLANALDTLVYYLILVLGAIVGLRFIGIGLSSLAIFAGVLGIGVGFGLRNITENFISGLIILWERPIKIGDYVEIDGAPEGRVESISARSTTVTTRDNISLIIPNSNFIGGLVTNWSYGDPKVRLQLMVGVAYGANTELTRKTLLEVASKHGQVLKKPKPEVHFRAFGASSLDMMLLVWIDDQHHRFRILSDLHFAIDKAFRKANIEIAFPQLDVHHRSVATPIVEAWRAPEVPEPAESVAPPVVPTKRLKSEIAGPAAGSKLPS